MIAFIVELARPHLAKLLAIAGAALALLVVVLWLDSLRDGYIKQGYNERVAEERAEQQKRYVNTTKELNDVAKDDAARMAEVTAAVPTISVVPADRVCLKPDDSGRGTSAPAAADKGSGPASSQAAALGEATIHDANLYPVCRAALQTCDETVDVLEQHYRGKK